MTDPPLPSRTLTAAHDVEQLEREVKELLDSNTLDEARLTLARAYGFPSWTKLKAHVEGAGAKRLLDAVRAGDLEQIREILRGRPELVNMGVGQDERRAILYAVIKRDPELTRLLMQHGADARSGVHPHREATTALMLAADRGYDDIVAVIHEEEQRRRVAYVAADTAAAPEPLFYSDAWESGRAMELLGADPALTLSANQNGMTPLHAAACFLHAEGVAWLLAHGADPNRPGRAGWKPIDLAASAKCWPDSATPATFQNVAKLLLGRGAELGAFSAVALGRADWIRQRHAAGELASPVVCDPVVGCVGVLSTAVRHERRDMAALLLDLGFDPDERMRVGGMDEIVYSAGLPLYLCVTQKNRELADVLLARGADPNANVYTSGSPLSRAYSQDNRPFIELLERHGGFLDAVSAGFAGQTEAARRLLADEAAGRLRPGAVIGDNTVAEDLLSSACGGGDPEIVRMALDRLDWPRTDSRWGYCLWQAFTCDGGIERGLACFRLILDRADPNTNDCRTILHTVMARGGEEHVPYVEMLLDAGARTDVRDELLNSTPLGWACRWGRVHFVKLLLDRGADPVEADAEPWATPLSWAQKKQHEDVVDILRNRLPRK